MKKNILFSLLLFATCFFSASAQTLISEDFSSAAWGTELLRLNPTYVKPPTNADVFPVTTTSLYFGKYALNGAIVSLDGVTTPNTTNKCALFTSKGIVHNNGGKAVAFRFRNSGITSFMEFPDITSAGTMTLHVRNGSSNTSTTLTLQKYVSGAWTTITTLTLGRADAYYASTVDEIITYNVNINGTAKLRLYGGDKFIFLFRVDIEAHYKVALLAAINTATALKTASAGNIGTTLGTYSQASYDTFGTAITAANTVNSNGSATQAQVDAAVVTLNAAVAAFLASINKVDLQTGITTATTLKNANTGNIGTGLGQVTQASYDALGAAISAASAVNTNVTATGAQVIAALATLNTAIATFRASINKVDLQTGIATATALKTANAGNIGTALGQYTQASYDALGTAITVATAVNTNQTATGAEVVAVLATLNTAMATFQASVNKVDLQTGITTATNLKNANTANIGTGSGQYTQASYDALGAAITAASAVNTNVTATGAQVIAALATLNTAVATFRASVNKVGLQTGITTATTLKNASTSKIGGGLGQYTQASYDALVAAIAAASAVNDNATATGAEVIAALATLNAAISTFQNSLIPVELLNVNFTVDSTYWRTKFPTLIWADPNLSVSVDGLVIDGYTFKGTYGKFNPGTGVMAQPIRNDKQTSHRRWAFRLNNTGDCYMELPPLTSAGKMTVWCKNGNAATEATYYIQKKTGSTWTTLKTIFVPPHYDRDYEQEVEEYINISSAVTLRIYGGSNNIHIYKVIVNSYDATKPAVKPCRLILLPDPQHYSDNEDNKPIYAAQTIWIANNSDSIKFVLCQGDMTQSNNDSQWSVAAGALTIPDGKKVPFTTIPGNHDIGNPGNANTRNSSMLNAYLPYSRYSRDPSFGGAFEVGKTENTWSTFTYGNYNFLILSLEFAVRNKVLDWAGTLIAAHPYHNIIINTHAFLGQDDQPLSGRWDNGISDDTGDEYSNDALEMWNKRFKQHKNVLLIFSGHILGTGIGHRVCNGVNGNTVYQYAANYQYQNIAGGNGFLRIIDMDPANHILKIQTYSPYIDQYDTTAGQHFYYNDVQFMENNGQYTKRELTNVENANSNKINVALEGKNLKIENNTGINLTTAIFNMQGVKILERSGFETGNIALPVSGCYIISISDKSGMYTYREKIIVP